MSWDHGTYGWEHFDGFLEGLKQAGTQYRLTELEEGYRRGSDAYGELQKLRRAEFLNSEGQKMVAEEYLAIDDGDCDGSSQVALSVHPEGVRPQLYRVILEGGHNRYPDAPFSGFGWPAECRLNLKDRTYERVGSEEQS